jgi:ABC-type polysaccharide/polyol phosphate transport system ATPase subunit
MANREQIGQLRQIVDFAGLGDFFDTPYNSPQAQGPLAFSVVSRRRAILPGQCGGR